MTAATTTVSDTKPMCAPSNGDTDKNKVVLSLDDYIHLPLISQAKKRVNILENAFVTDRRVINRGYHYEGE